MAEKEEDRSFEDYLKSCRKKRMCAVTINKDTFYFTLNDIEELKQYRAIGTVNECKEAAEKQKAKKPIRNDLCTCPKCETYNEIIKKRRNTVNYDIVYCWHCGQAIEVNTDEGRC